MSALQVCPLWPIMTMLYWHVASWDPLPRQALEHGAVQWLCEWVLKGQGHKAALRLLCPFWRALLHSAFHPGITDLCKLLVLLMHIAVSYFGWQSSHLHVPVIMLSGIGPVLFSFCVLFSFYTLLLSQCAALTLHLHNRCWKPVFDHNVLTSHIHNSLSSLIAVL